MGVNATEFESFEQQFIELIGELQTITSSERRLRESLRAEATRAESAEAARDAADRTASEARSNAAASAASAAQATVTLGKIHEELAATKMQFELAERHRALLEEKCSELSLQLDAQSRELQKLRPLQTAQTNLQRQYAELQERVHSSTSDARNLEKRAPERQKREASKLEAELRRVEKLASGGAELRERARLAAAAHVRERRLAAADLQHANHEMHTAKAEVTKLGAHVAELQYRLSSYEKQSSSSIKKSVEDPTAEALAEARAALEAERAGTARLEQALAAALADNAALAARLHTSDNPTAPEQPKSLTTDASNTNAIGPIDSFLAE